jgi:protein ImuB
MSVPSYDDLTPGIPDEVDAKAADRLALFLGIEGHEAHEGHEGTTGRLVAPASVLYACLRLCDPQTADCGLPSAIAVARDFSPRICVASGSDVLLDVSGLGRLIGPPDEIARQLRRALGTTARVAVAPTQTAARLLAAAGESDMARLPSLSIDLLRPLEMLPLAMSPRDRARPYETLERWGIATLGELAALPAAALSSRLGRRGVALQQLARGLDTGTFVPDRETPRYIGRLELEWPIEALEPLSFVFARLLEPLALALDRADRAAAAVRLDLRLTDRSTEARVLQLPAPIRDPRVLRTLLLLDLESGSLFRRDGDGPSGVMVDVVTIELDPAPARVTQFSLLRRPLPSPETLSTLIARLSALCGETRVGAAALLDSHRPDGFAMTRYAPREGASGSAGSAAAVASAVLRRERRSVALSVSLERGRPVHIASSRRGIPYGAIVQAAGPWRTSGEWWSDRSWNHNEWDVALKSGVVCRIHQDRTTERWFFEGIYD